MAWFKVDDGTHSHKKTRRAGIEAMGMWVVCGSWSADNLEDGFVPSYVAETFTTRAHQYAKRLVSAGLWSEATKDGDSGWQFHDWDAYQPMRDDVEAKRDAWRERQRKARSQKQVSRSDTGVTHARQPRESRESHGESHAPVTESRPVPSRPVQLPTEVVPVGDSLAPLAATATAQTLIGEWLDHTEPRPPGRVIGQVSKEIKAMLDEGQPYADVRNGLAAWATKGLHPSTLASVVHETRTPKTPTRKAAGIDWQAALDRAQERDRNAS